MLKNRISAYRNERQNRKTENRNAPLRYGRFTMTSISKYEHFTHKINKTYPPIKAAHFDFDRCPCGGGLRPENPPDRHFS